MISFDKPAAALDVTSNGQVLSQHFDKPRPFGSQTDGMVTIVTSDYLPQAYALATSVREHSPSTSIHICIVDRCELPPPLLDVADCFFGDELGIDNWLRFAFQYTGFELSCAIKPHAIRFLFERREVKRAIYLDSDILVYRSLDDLFGRLDYHDFLLTPHLSSPLPHDGLLPDDYVILRAGAYNGGFIGARGTTNGSAILQWLTDKLTTQCIVDEFSHLLVDQTWLGLIPSVFENVHIEGGRGYNAAYWNLPHRPLAYQMNEDRFVVAGEPLTFFHFSGYSSSQPDRLSKFDQRYRLSEHPCLRTLVDQYTMRLADARGILSFSPNYTFGCLSDGTPIDGRWRELIRLNHPAFLKLANPFDTDTCPQLIRRYRQAVNDVVGSRRGVAITDVWRGRRWLRSAWQHVRSNYLD